MKIAATKNGFTLIEVLVVVAIIGILAAVVLASLGESRELANIRKAQADMRNIHTAMEIMFNDTGQYPHQQPSYCPPELVGGNEANLSDASTGLVANDGSFQNWKGPYVTNVLDPWGNPYFFDEDYFCNANAVGCNGYESSNFTVAGRDYFSVLVSCGPDDMQGNDSSNPQPTNGAACAYNDDNVVYILCEE